MEILPCEMCSDRPAVDCGMVTQFAAGVYSSGPMPEFRLVLAGANGCPPIERAAATKPARLSFL
jgi:hypothetical protein